MPAPRGAGSRSDHPANRSRGPGPEGFRQPHGAPARKAGGGLGMGESRGGRHGPTGRNPCLDHGHGAGRMESVPARPSGWWTGHPDRLRLQHRPVRGRVDRRSLAVFRPVEHGDGRPHVRERRGGSGRRESSRHPTASGAESLDAHAPDGHRRLLEGLFAIDDRRGRLGWLFCRGILFRPGTSPATRCSRGVDRRHLGWNAHRAVDASGRIRERAGARRRMAARPVGGSAVRRAPRANGRTSAPHGPVGGRFPSGPGQGRSPAADAHLPGGTAAAAGRPARHRAVQRHAASASSVRVARGDLVPGRVEQRRGPALHRAHS